MTEEYIAAKMSLPRWAVFLEARRDASALPPLKSEPKREPQRSLA